MPVQKQIENPQGAFGYLTTVNTPTPGELHAQRVTRVRNMSTSNPIRLGDAVVWAFSTQAAWGSTAGGVLGVSSVDEGVFRTTVPGHPGFAGIAIGPTLSSSIVNVAAVRSTGSTLGAPAPSSEYCNIVTYGPVFANISTIAADAAVAGSPLMNSASTLTTAAGSSGGGLLGIISTATLTSAGGFQLMAAIVGFAITDPTTGSTGFLSTSISRSLIYVQPSVFRVQAAGTTA